MQSIFEATLHPTYPHRKFNTAHKFYCQTSKQPRSPYSMIGAACSFIPLGYILSYVIFPQNTKPRLLAHATRDPINDEREPRPNIDSNKMLNVHAWLNFSIISTTPQEFYIPLEKSSAFSRLSCPQLNIIFHRMEANVSRRDKHIMKSLASWLVKRNPYGTHIIRHNR